MGSVKPMSRTAQALELVKGGMGIYAAARQMGVKGPSVYRLIKYRESRAAARNLAVCQQCGACVVAAQPNQGSNSGVLNSNSGVLNSNSGVCDVATGGASNE